MELCRLFFLVSVFLPIICAEITYAESTRNQNDVVGRPEGAQLELHRLKSKISSLGSEFFTFVIKDVYMISQESNFRADASEAVWIYNFTFVISPFQFGLFC